MRAADRDLWVRGVPVTAADGGVPVVTCQFMLGKGEIGSGIGADLLTGTGFTTIGC